MRSIPQIPDSSVVFTSHSWSALLKRLSQMALTGSSTEEGFSWSITPGGPGAHTAVASMLFLRGEGAHDYEHIVKSCALRNANFHASWIKDPLAVRFTPTPLMSRERSASLLLNSSCVAPSLDSILSRAWGMLDAGAYLHQYERHGVERDTMESAMISLEQVLMDYQSLK